MASDVQSSVPVPARPGGEPLVQGQDADEERAGAPAPRRRSLAAAMVTSLARGKTRTCGDDDHIDHDDLIASAAADTSGSGSGSGSSSDRKKQFQKKKTFLAPEVQEELEKSDPLLVRWLSSATGLFVQFGMLALYIFIDTAKGLTTKWAVDSGKVQTSSLVIMNSLFSIVIGFGLCYQLEGKESAIAAMKDFNMIKKFSLVAALFSVATVFNILAYSTELDAGTIKILGQLRLPLAALMSRFLVGKVYTTNQWYVLAIVTLVVSIFYDGAEDRDEETDRNEALMHSGNGFTQCLDSIEKEDIKNHVLKCTVEGYKTALGKTSDEVGLIYLVTYIFITVSASLLSERYLKSAMDTPFYVQKMQMEITGGLVAIIMSFIVPLFVEGAAWDDRKAKKMWWMSTDVACYAKDKGVISPWTQESACAHIPESGKDCSLDADTKNVLWNDSVGGKGLFESWGWPAVCQLLLAILQAWTGGIIVKKFSTVVKNIAKSCSLVVTVFANELLFRRCCAPDLKRMMYTLSLTIFLLTLLFSQLEQDAKGAKAKKPKEEQSAAPPSADVQLREVPVTAAR